jgi:hypothetical protein
MNDHCPQCKVKLGQEVWSAKPVTYQVPPPWSPMYELWTGTCPNCKSPIRSLFTTKDSRPLNWLVTDEDLLWGADYKGIYTRRRGRSRLGVMPVNVVWAWVPARTPEFVYRLAERIQEIILADPSKSLVIVLPYGVVWTDLLSLEPKIDDIWELGPHVMQGEVGPYPSLRAELSLKQTFAQQRLNMIYHFWPSASLDPKGYIPIGTADEVAQAWATFSRQKIAVTVNKDSK